MATAGKHQRAADGTDTWLTPPALVRAVGPFELDPCCPPAMPWRTAAEMIHHPPHDGLAADWGRRFVWMNPPYGRATEAWLGKLATHDHGVALVFARVETGMFFRHVWGKASAMVFLKGRLRFHDAAGRRAGATVAPSVLIGYGEVAAYRLGRAVRRSLVSGHYVPLPQEGN